MPIPRRDVNVFRRHCNMPAGFLMPTHGSRRFIRNFTDDTYFHAVKARQHESSLRVRVRLRTARSYNLHALGERFQSVLPGRLRFRQSGTVSRRISIVLVGCASAPAGTRIVQVIEVKRFIRCAAPLTRENGAPVPDRRRRPYRIPTEQPQITPGGRSRLSLSEQAQARRPKTTKRPAAASLPIPDRITAHDRQLVVRSTRGEAAPSPILTAPSNKDNEINHIAQTRYATGESSIAIAVE